MLRIRCSNPDCTAPDRIFAWNERPHLMTEGRLAQEGDDGAVAFVVYCKSCGTKNKIWVTRLLTKGVTRGR